MNGGNPLREYVMQKMLILLLVVFTAAGAPIAYVMYRQLDTGTVMLEATPQLEVNAQGQQCGEVNFMVEARSLGRWMLPVEDGQTVTGVVAVEGDETSDIVFRIWSPTNRPVLTGAERTHQQEFELSSTIRGEYRFEFDNRHSTFMPKQVTVSLCLT